MGIVENIFKIPTGNVGNGGGGGGHEESELKL